VSRAGKGDLGTILLDKHGARPELDPDQVVGLNFILLGPGAYCSFVLEAGWSEKPRVT
jgi:hypothetical protein